MDIPYLPWIAFPLTKSSWQFRAWQGFSIPQSKGTRDKIVHPATDSADLAKSIGKEIPEPRIFLRELRQHTAMYLFCKLSTTR